ncbi:MAG TPA: MmcQ/YjbR family DNA-binding protein [Polyangiaceae bacterium]|nr:MmcQ/YjbR family DNA-binding protein [Polyangiaceae bacterium]
MTPKSKSSVLEELRRFGLTYPDTHLKSPWPGHLDLAVRDKTFAFLSAAGEQVNVSCKLPDSGALALELPFVTPTGYGLGRSGWVTAKFPVDGKLPVEMLKDWIDESYRAQAPKKLSAQVARRGASGAPPGGRAKEAARTRRPVKPGERKKVPTRKAVTSRK